MEWGNVTVLWWLAAVPVLAVVLGRDLIIGGRRRRDFAHDRMLLRLFPPSDMRRRAARLAFCLAASVLLIAAWARPRWGATTEVFEQEGADIFIILDVSRSMLANDVTPNRLERAKSDVKDLLTRLEGDRVGLIAFAGAAVIRVPLTTDLAYVRLALDELGPESVPRGGSLIGDAIRKAISAFPLIEARSRSIVIITDGEDHESFPLDAARHAKEEGIVLFTIGLGDVAEGSRVPREPDRRDRGFLQFNGQEVWSKLDEDLLKRLALETGGAYVPARTTHYDLGELYTNHLQRLTRGALDPQERTRFAERFQWFLAPAVGLLLLARLGVASSWLHAPAGRDVPSEVPG